jgi:3-oxoacyl-[acyl-carrier-protein] synthase-3
MLLYPVSITGIGRYLPKKVITNDDIARLVDTSDEWITSRTGIRERRVVGGDETATSMASAAARDAMHFARVAPADIDLIIVATSLPDSLYPSTACEVQAEIGADNAAAFNVVAACSGLVYGISIARNFIMTGTYRTVLLIGVDVHSRFLNWSDKSTCILFGDAAGALLLQCSPDGVNEILSVDIRSNGNKANELYIPLQGQACPFVIHNGRREQVVNMNGKEIYKFAVSSMPYSIKSALALAGLEVRDIDYLIPHQANIKIINSIAEKVGLTPGQVVTNLDRYGNTSTASIPVALVEELEKGTIKIPSTMAMCGFGAGLTWGTAIVKWRAVDRRKPHKKTHLHHGW